METIKRRVIEIEIDRLQQLLAMLDAGSDRDWATTRLFDMVLKLNGLKSIEKDVKPPTKGGRRHDL